VQLEQSFEVSAPIGDVWQALINVERVAPCLPGAQITGRGEDGSYEGAFSVKIGPTSAAYTGRLEMTVIDEAAHTATMKADGTDRRGQGGASAMIVSKLSEVSPQLTRVEVNTDYRITGRLARFGRGGMIEDISQKLLRQFADNLQESLNRGGGETSEAEPGVPSTPQGPTGGRTGGEAPVEAPVPGATPPPVEALDAGNLLGGVLLERIRRNPLPLIAIAAVLLLLRRRDR
jgi:carbon monoxide dehydrogenase subunit G